MKDSALIRGVRYAVTQQGTHSNDALLLLHGFTGASESFLDFMTIALDSFRVIAPDLLGHGQTEAPHDAGRYTMSEAVADLAALLDALHVERTHLLGYSMGGRLALSFAIAHPGRVRKLVLESASPGLETETMQRERRAADERLASEIENGGLAAFVRKWANIPLFESQRSLPDHVLHRQQSIRESGSAIGYAQSLRGMGTGRQPSNWDALGQVGAPTLLVTGALDSKFCEINRRMAQMMPRATHHVITQAGHTPHLEQPASFQKVVFEFLLQNTFGEISLQ